MYLLNWIYWKKFLFTSGVIGLSGIPIGLIHKYSSGTNSLDVSSYKKNVEYLISGGQYANQFGISQLAKDILGIPDMKSGVDDVFAEDLSLLAVEKSGLFKTRYKELVKEEQANYDNDGKRGSAKYFDYKGGSREAMKRRALTEKAHADFKKELLDFDHNNFTLNRFADTKHVVDYGAHMSETLIKNKDNWKNIGFFSRGESKDKHDPLFAKYKFEFINFAHKVWFQEARPFYVWMSLWKHKEKPTKGELDTFWDVDKLREKKVYVNTSSYNFPYFDNKSPGTNTTQKFKNFFNNVVKKHESSSQVYISKGYTEDSATSILVEGSNMYSSLYVRFAAAANYKYQQKLQQRINSSSSNTWINQREKNTTVDNYKQPTELFMFSSSDGSGTKARVKVSKDIFKQGSNKSSNEIADLVEIKDTPWVFIRNRAGIHAMAVDIENMESSSKDVYGHFQYRTLQALYKHHLSLSQTLDIQVNGVVETFKNFLSKHFNRLLLKYVYEKYSGNTFFGFDVPFEIRDFKDAFVKSEELNELRNRYFSRIRLREALINSYVQIKWDVDSSSNKFSHADISKGMVGMIPWKMKTDESDATKDSYVFEELEKIYDFEFFKGTDESTASSVRAKQLAKQLAKEYGEKLNEYTSKVNAFVDKLGLTLNADASGITSDRIFSNNYYANRINDKFLDAPDTFNEFLFKYLVKSGYVGKSVLGNKGFIEKTKNFGFTIPDSFKPNTSGAGGNDVIDKIDMENNDENIKKVFGKIDDQVVTNYYSRLLLEKESVNPWDAAKYGATALKKEKNKLRENLQKISKQAFEDRFVFSDGNFRSNHYKFLTALTYLTRDNFANLLKHLKNFISHNSDSYVVFSKPSIVKHEVKLSEDSLNNPFLNREIDWNTTELKKSVENIYKYFSATNFNDSGSKVDSGFVYLGFYNESSAFNLAIPDQYRSKFNADKLYRYGSSKDDMNKYVVNQISTEDEFKKVVEKIKKATETETSKDWVNNLTKDQIYVTNSGNANSKTLKILTLQEKKNLLSAYLNDVKVEINNDSIEKSQYKTVFLTDPDNNFNSTGSPHTKASGGSKDEKIKDVFLKPYQDIKDQSNNNIFKLFQINSNNVEDWEKFKTYVNINMSSDVFWAWVIDLALLPSIQDSALSDLSSSERIKVFDARWDSVGKDKFVKK